MTATVGIDGGNMLGARSLDMTRHITLQNKNACMGRSNEDTSLPVLTDVAHHTLLLF